MTPSLQSTPAARPDNAHSPTSDPVSLINATRNALGRLAEIMNEETTLLRNGQYEQAAGLSARKATIGQEYVQLARKVQKDARSLRETAPRHIRQLQNEHEKLATQIAQNLKVLATARTVAQSILSDVAESISRTGQPDTYAPDGHVTPPTRDGQASGISFNRSL